MERRGSEEGQHEFQVQEPEMQQELAAEDELPPSWDDFLDKYGEHIGKLGHISEEPLTAQELHDQARRFDNNSAKGLDGWYPR